VAQGLALAKSLGAKVSVIFAVKPFEGLVRFSKSALAAEELAKYAEWRKERVGSRGKCGQGRWPLLRDNSSGERATL
jgi:hypothetical protein